jgi:hypothetical protein
MHLLLDTAALIGQLDYKFCHSTLFSGYQFPHSIDAAARRTVQTTLKP